jgi:hypothetical protein
MHGSGLFDIVETTYLPNLAGNRCAPAKIFSWLLKGLLEENYAHLPFALSHKVHRYSARRKVVDQTDAPVSERSVAHWCRHSKALIPESCQDGEGASGRANSAIQRRTAHSRTDKQSRESIRIA